MNDALHSQLRESLELADNEGSALYAIGRILLQIVVELDRIAEAQEAAHK